jgi:hypothetical protein
VSPHGTYSQGGVGCLGGQVVDSSRRGSRDTEHIVSASDEVQPEVLEAAARQRLAVAQGEPDLGLEPSEPARLGAADRGPAGTPSKGSLSPPWSSPTRPLPANGKQPMLPSAGSSTAVPGTAAAFR